MIATQRQMDDTGQGAIVVVRHCETAKNVLGRHGVSDLATLTERGLYQLGRLAGSLGGMPLARVVSTPTAQARTTAAALANRLQLSYEGDLALRPYGLGLADGLTDLELAALDPEGMRSMSAFRSGAIPVSEVRIQEAESWESVRSRLRKWWASEDSRRVLDAVVVTSRSTFLMIDSLLAGEWDSPRGYEYGSLANGDHIQWRLVNGHWETRGRRVGRPRVEVAIDLPSMGRIRGILERPRYDTGRPVLVLVPGFFGATSEGPYSLYRQIGARLVEDGFPVLRYDPLGSGVSDPIWRTLRTDCQSLSAVLAWCEVHLGANGIIKLAHSLGCVPALQSSYQSPSSILISPLSQLVGSERDVLDSHAQQALLERGICERTRIALSVQDVALLAASWECNATAVQLALVGSDDTYYQPIPALADDCVATIAGGDHNFSTRASFEILYRALIHFLDRSR